MNRLKIGYKNVKNNFQSRLKKSWKIGWKKVINKLKIGYKWVKISYK